MNIKLFSNNQSNVDIFGFNGLAEIVNGILRYKEFKIKFSEKNKESLYHLVKKDILSSQKKTKFLIEKILAKYHNEEEFVVSMQLIRILEYMDDNLLEAISRIKLNDEGSFIDFEKNKNHILLLINNLAIKETKVSESWGQVFEPGDYEDAIANIGRVDVDVYLENIYKPSPELLCIRDFLEIDD